VVITFTSELMPGVSKLFLDKGTQTILWPGLWAESVKITKSGIPNDMDSCVIFILERSLGNQDPWVIRIIWG
jgi:hypothetical protein